MLNNKAALTAMVIGMAAYGAYSAPRRLEPVRRQQESSKSQQDRIAKAEAKRQRRIERNKKVSAKAPRRNV